MSAKNVDRHNRFRSITVGFRVSPEENEQLNRAIALSGLPKQEYCYQKCITGTSTKHREGFKRMIADALDGRIEILSCKLIQCFPNHNRETPWNQALWKVA